MKHFVAALAGLIAFVCAPFASAAILTATAADWPAVVTQLRPGDTLKLVGAFPAQMRPRGAYLKGVTIQAQGATVGGLFYPGGAVEDLAISGGTWAGLRIDGAFGLKVSGAARFVGPDPATGFGIYVNTGRDIAVTDSSFENFKGGIAVNKAQGILIERNGFSRMSSDGVTLGDVRFVTVRQNFFHGTRITAGAHPDAVQVFTSKAAAEAGEASTDILIEDNKVTGMTQGIGLFDPPYARVVIRNNDIVGGYPHGIALGPAADSAVYGNTVATYPGAQYRASVNVDPSVKTCGNAVAPGAGKVGLAATPC